MILVLFAIVLCAAQTSPNVGSIALSGSCNVATEIAITGSTTNTSATAVCTVGTCNYDITDSNPNPILTCRLGWNFAGTGERIQAVHIHWKAFTPPTGTAVPADKFVFTLGGGLDTDNGETFVTATPISADFKAAIRYYATLVAQAGTNGLYANFHSNWSPPSPMGAMAGRLVVPSGSGVLPVSADTGSIILLPANPACNVATEMAITGSTTNTSAAATCSVTACTYDIRDSQANPTITCTLGWNFANTGEVIQAVHIHWRNFTTPAGTFVLTDKFVFTLSGTQVNTNSGTVTVTSGTIPASLKLAIRFYSTLVFQNGIKGLYANFHSNWSPPSPFGAVAGYLYASSSSVVVPSLVALLCLLLVLF